MGYPNANGNDAFMMKLNDLAIPVWYTTFSLSKVVDDSITALTKAGDFIYAFIITSD